MPRSCFPKSAISKRIPSKSNRRVTLVAQGFRRDLTHHEPDSSGSRIHYLAQDLEHRSRAGNGQQPSDQSRCVILLDPGGLHRDSPRHRQPRLRRCRDHRYAVRLSPDHARNGRSWRRITPGRVAKPNDLARSRTPRSARPRKAHVRHVLGHCDAACHQESLELPPHITPEAATSRTGLRWSSFHGSCASSYSTIS